jgi:hypothetical protein
LRKLKERRIRDGYMHPLKIINSILKNKGDLYEASRYYKEVVVIAEHLKSPIVKIIRKNIKILQSQYKR